jgi:DNA-binding NtrC family response regulator
MAHVFIVEDETQVCMLAESILQQAGHDTLSAATVAEAQSIINSDETFDLVFTDLQLGAHAEGCLHKRGDFEDAVVLVPAVDGDEPEAGEAPDRASDCSGARHTVKLIT